MSVKLGNRAYKEQGLSGLKTMYNYYRKNARDKSIDFHITFDEFRVIVKQDCSYCGSAPKQKVRRTSTKKSVISQAAIDWGTSLVNGVDRINNAFGYVANNMQPCCSACNYMKWNKSEGEFLAHVRRIYTHTRRSKRT